VSKPAPWGGARLLAGGTKTILIGRSPASRFYSIGRGQGMEAGERAATSREKSVPKVVRGQGAID